MGVLALPVAIFGALVYEDYQDTAPYADDRCGLSGYNHGRYLTPDSSYLQARTRTKRAMEQTIAQQTQGWGPPDGENEFRNEHAPQHTTTTPPPPPTGQPAQVEGSPDVTYHPVNDGPCRDGSTLIRTQCVSWSSVLEDLTNFRQGLTAGAADAKKVAVVARLDVAGTSFYGINAHGQPTGFPLPKAVNIVSPDHAEGDVFWQFVQSGLTGDEGSLYVNAKLCSYCKQINGVRGMARFAGLKRITIFTPEWLNGVTFDL